MKISQGYSWYVRIVIQGSLFLGTTSFLFADPSSTIVDKKTIREFQWISPTYRSRKM